MTRMLRKQVVLGAWLVLSLNAVLARAAESGAAAVSPDQAGAAVLHSQAPEHMPFFITRPGQTDWLMVFTAIFFTLAVLGFGNLFWKLHTLPERIAHKSEKLQFEIIAILGLLSLFTHEHLFWVIGLLLAFIEFPDFATPMGRIATSLETIADATGALVNDGEAVRELEPARAEVQGRAESPVKRSVAAERPAAAKG